MSNQSGFSLLETLLCLSLLVTLLMGGFAISYMYFLNTWVNYQSYEALMCAVEHGRPIDECLNQYHKHVRKFLPRGVEHQGRLTRNRGCAYFHSFIRARLRWKLHGSQPYQVWRKDLSACLPREMNRDL